MVMVEVIREKSEREMIIDQKPDFKNPTFSTFKAVIMGREIQFWRFTQNQTFLSNFRIKTVDEVRKKVRRVIFTRCYCMEKKFVRRNGKKRIFYCSCRSVWSKMYENTFFIILIRHRQMKTDVLTCRRELQVYGVGLEQS